MKRFLFLLMFLSVAGILNGQTVLEGMVTDSQSGETIIGATGAIIGTTQGTITDMGLLRAF